VKARFFSAVLLVAARFSRTVSSVPSRPSARARSSLRGRLLLWPSRPSAERGAYSAVRYQSGRGARPAGYHRPLSLSLSRARVPTSILASLFTLYLARLALRRSWSNFRAIARSFAYQFSLSPHVPSLVAMTELHRSSFIQHRGYFSRTTSVRKSEEKRRRKSERNRANFSLRCPAELADRAGVDSFQTARYAIYFLAISQTQRRERLLATFQLVIHRARKHHQARESSSKNRPINQSIYPRVGKNATEGCARVSVRRYRRSRVTRETRACRSSWRRRNKESQINRRCISR